MPASSTFVRSLCTDQQQLGVRMPPRKKRMVAPADGGVPVPEETLKQFRSALDVAQVATMSAVRNKKDVAGEVLEAMIQQCTRAVQEARIPASGRKRSASTGAGASTAPGLSAAGKGVDGVRALERRLVTAVSEVSDMRAKLQQWKTILEEEKASLQEYRRLAAESERHAQTLQSRQLHPLLKLAPAGERFAPSDRTVPAFTDLEQDEELKRVCGSLVRKLNRVEESSQQLLPLLHELGMVKEQVRGILMAVAPDAEAVFL